MDNRVKQVAAVLHHGAIRFELDGDRATVHIIWIGAAVGWALCEHRSVAIAFVVVDDRLKPFALGGELPLEFLER
jgi:hypothetical protein